MKKNPNKKNHKYKALIIDVDGTLVPNKPDGMPSERVTRAINKANSLLHVGLATGRPVFLIRHLVSHLRLSGPSIISGGAQVYDVTTDTVLSEQYIEKQDIARIARVTWTYNARLQMDGTHRAVTITPDTLPQKALGFFVSKLSAKEAETLIATLSNIPTVNVSRVPDWSVGKYSLHITHAAATKQHGILEIAQRLNIQTQDIIGIGDGGNDMPLLMACGFRVAMGNADDDLKAIADYVAPRVEDDGVAHVIEKFIL